MWENPPGGAEHGKKWIVSKKPNATLKEQLLNTINVFYKQCCVLIHPWRIQTLRGGCLTVVYFFKENLDPVIHSKIMIKLKFYNQNAIVATIATFRLAYREQIERLLKI